MLQELQSGSTTVPAEICARPSAKIKNLPPLPPPPLPPPPLPHAKFCPQPTPNPSKKTCIVMAKTQTCLPTLTKICVVISQSTIPPPHLTKKPSEHNHLYKATSSQNANPLALNMSHNTDPLTLNMSHNTCPLTLEVSQSHNTDPMHSPWKSLSHTTQTQRTHPGSLPVTQHRPTALTLEVCHPTQTQRTHPGSLSLTQHILTHPGSLSVTQHRPNALTLEVCQSHSTDPMHPPWTSVTQHRPSHLEVSQ